MELGACAQHTLRRCPGEETPPVSNYLPCALFLTPPPSFGLQMAEGGLFFTSVPALSIPHMEPFHFGSFTPVGLAVALESAGFEVPHPSL